MNSSAVSESQRRTQQMKLEQLESRLQREFSGRVLDLRLSIDGSGVVLQGRAHSFYAKQLVQHAVMKCADFTISRNEIEIV